MELWGLVVVAASLINWHQQCAMLDRLEQPFRIFRAQVCAARLRPGSTLEEASPLLKSLPGRCSCVLSPTSTFVDGALQPGPLYLAEHHWDCGIALRWRYDNGRDTFVLEEARVYRSLLDYLPGADWWDE